MIQLCDYCDLGDHRACDGNGCECAHLCGGCGEHIDGCACDRAWEERGEP